MAIFESIGQWMRQQRKLLGLTQARLAKEVGCAVVTIKKIEQETRRPSREMAELLARHLHVPAAEVAHFVQLARGQSMEQKSVSTPIPLPAFLQERESTAQPHQSSILERPAFVARHEELQWLQARLGQTLTTRQPQIAFVRGEAGRGKTALLTAFANAATEKHEQLLVAGGLCTAHIGQGAAFLPFRNIFELLSGALEAQWYSGTLSCEQAYRLWRALPHMLNAVVHQGPALLDTLLPLTPLYTRLTTHGLLTHFAHEAWIAKITQLYFALNENRTTAAHVSQASKTDTVPPQQIFEQITRVVRALAEQQPLLLLLDDIQWIDESSLALLFHLSRRLAGSPVLIVGAYRGNELDSVHPLTTTLHELTRRFGEITLDLDRLDQQNQGRPFLDALLDRQPNQLDDRFRRQLLAQTGGHPLFTLELLRHLQEEHYLITDSAKGWVQRQPLTLAMLPARIEAVLSQRIAQVDDELQELLTVAAVEGERFSAQTIATVLERSERKVLQQLDVLQSRHHLVHEQNQVRINETHFNHYHFHHALFQQYCYQRLSRGERRLLHRNVAHTLEMFYGADNAAYAVTLAYHFSAGGEEATAATYRLLAGDHARRQSALIEAVTHYRVALAQWPADDAEGRAILLDKLGDVLWVTGQTQSAMEAFQEALSLFTSQGDDLHAGSVLRRIGRLYWELGQLDASWQHYWAAIERLESCPESVELAEAMSAIAQMQMMVSQQEDAIHWSQRARQLAERVGAEHVVIHALNNLGAVLVWQEVDRGLALLCESLERAKAANQHYDVCRAHYNLSDIYISLGRYADAYAEAQALVTYASDIHSIQMTMAGLLKTVEAEWYRGRWRHALTHFAQLNEWRKAETFNPIGDVMAVITLGMIYNDGGQAQDAYELLTAAAKQVRAGDEIQLILPFLGQLMRATIEQGKHVETLACIEEVAALVAKRPTCESMVGETLRIAYEWLLKQLATEWNDNDNAAKGKNNDESSVLVRLSATIEEQLNSFVERSPALTTAAIEAEANGIRALHEYNLYRGCDEKHSFYLAQHAGSHSELSIAEAIAQLQSAAQTWQEADRPYEQLRLLRILLQIMQQVKDADRTFVEKAIAQIEQRLADQLVDIVLPVQLEMRG